MVEARGASDPQGARTAQYIGIGCLTAIAGAFSGGMIAVFVAKFVGSATGCAPPAGLPACNWYYYAPVGMLVGAVTLPLLSLWRFRRGDRDPRKDPLNSD